MKLSKQSRFEQRKFPNTLVIAEAGVNHNGDIKLAFQLIDAAKEAGADIVKFQTSNPETSVSRNAPRADYQVKSTGEKTSQLEMLKGLSLDKVAHESIYSYCRKKQIEFLSTPFFVEGVNLLVNQLGIKRLKISSGEIVNGPLLLKASQTGVPIILSTGMCILDEIKEALGVIAFGYTKLNEQPSLSAFSTAFQSDNGQMALRQKATLLHCTTEYPAPYEEMNLRAMDTLKNVFGLPVGFSDHSRGVEMAIAAVARGACVIEKHLTLDRNLPGPDHQASLEPGELKTMISAIRNVEKGLGDGEKMPTNSELENRQVVRKSLVAACPINKGDVFTTKNLAIKRPGNGMSPMEYWDLLGKISENSFLTDEVIVQR